MASCVRRCNCSAIWPDASPALRVDRRALRLPEPPFQGADLLGQPLVLASQVGILGAQSSGADPATGGHRGRSGVGPFDLREQVGCPYTVDRATFVFFATA
ncbi:hypothetical protein [Blastococcus mobilis]|uniref:hypothetical protein n=1 Tax=Blastococcus mobilis TaxID=1938746 RepID=UPI001131C843|nr:hypothetical protein [Blastococcus mobilis]